MASPAAHHFAILKIVNFGRYVKRRKHLVEVKEKAIADIIVWELSRPCFRIDRTLHDPYHFGQLVG